MQPAIQMSTGTAEAADSIRLRSVGPSDAGFLLRVYASTREEELAQVDWTEEQRAAFLLMQFTAQTHHYTTGYPGAEFQIILIDSQPAGRLYVHRRADEIRIMDIALLPPFRGQGVGTRLMRELLEEGERTDRKVSIHVEAFNPARRWYERLGFQPAATNGVYLLMEHPTRGDRSPHGSPSPYRTHTS